MMRCARSAGPRPRRSASPCSVTMTWTECSLWSTWLQKGTIDDTLPPLAMEWQTNTERRALRSKSPAPPSPFSSCVPHTCVELMCP